MKKEIFKRTLALEQMPPSGDEGLAGNAQLSGRNINRT